MFEKDDILIKIRDLFSFGKKVDFFKSVDFKKGRLIFETKDNPNTGEIYCIWFFRYTRKYGELQLGVKVNEVCYTDLKTAIDYFDKRSQSVNPERL